MRVQGGLQPQDWFRWGQFTTFKENAAVLLAKELRGNQAIYCSPLVDPYQPTERTRGLMPEILERVAHSPPRRFVIQTRGALILRDLPLLVRIPGLRVSFSLTTNRDDVQRRFEPHCDAFSERLRVIAALRDAGVAVTATLAPLLPCDPEALAIAALRVTAGDLVGDPLHIRRTKPRGATTREAAILIADRCGYSDWLDPDGQARLVARIAGVVRQHGRRFLTGPAGFALLSE